MLKVYDLLTKEKLFEVQAHNKSYIAELDYDENTDMLVSCSEDKSIAFINLGEKRVVKKIENLCNCVHSIKIIWFCCNTF